jgi:hypothetical protein
VVWLREGARVRFVDRLQTHRNVLTVCPESALTEASSGVRTSKKTKEMMTDEEGENGKSEREREKKKKKKKNECG